MQILAIETSCDETSASVVQDGKKILSNIVYSQKVHSKYGGVVPELASRAHLEKVNYVIASALKKAHRSVEDCDAVAFTSSPGLIGSLLVGQIAAETMAYIFSKKIVGVNHLEGHIYSSMLENEFYPPFISLIASGGHTDLIVVSGYGKYKLLGRTRDDAAGEALDKLAKLLKLKYPGGPEVEKYAENGDASAVDFPRPYMPKTWDFSFSGLKTAALYYLKKTVKGYPLSPIPHTLTCNICASFQDAVTDTLVEKVFMAANKTGIKKIALGGGVVSNTLFRTKLARRAQAEKIQVFFPSPKYCTDNAAMIGVAAYYRLKYGKKNRSYEVTSESLLKSWS